MAELSQHLDQRYQELRAAGTSDADARRVATLELDDSDALANPDALELFRDLPELSS